MEFKRFIPILIIIPVLAGLVVYGQNRLSPGPLQTQIPGGANSLEQISRFQLALELTDAAQIEMDYEKPTDDETFVSVRRANPDGKVERVEGDPALQQVQSLVQNMPSFGDSEPLALIQAVLKQEGISADKLRNIDLRFQLKDGMEKVINLQHQEEQPEPKPTAEQQTSQRAPAAQQPALPAPPQEPSQQQAPTPPEPEAEQQPAEEMMPEEETPPPTNDTETDNNTVDANNTGNNSVNNDITNNEDNETND